MNDCVAAPLVGRTPFCGGGAPLVCGGAGGSVVVGASWPPPGCIHAGGCSPASARTRRAPASFRPTLALPRGARAGRAAVPWRAFAAATGLARLGVHVIASCLIANAIVPAWVARFDYASATRAGDLSIPNAVKKATAGRRPRAFAGRASVEFWSRVELSALAVLLLRLGSLPRACLDRRARARRYTGRDGNSFLYPSLLASRHELPRGSLMVHSWRLQGLSNAIETESVVFRSGKKPGSNPG